MNSINSFDLPPAPLRVNLRQQWMLAEDVAFLNHGSFGAVPRAVYDAQDQWRRRIEADPVEILGRRNFGLIDQAREPIAKFLGVSSADFGFVTNATEGVNAVLRSLEFQPGDELLTTNHVYHAVRQAMRLTARRWGAQMRAVEIPLPVRSPDQIAKLVVDGLSSRTRLLVIDHITSPTALIFPMEPIVAGCRDRGVEVLIDGAHAPGMIPLDIGKLNPTYYTANFHKWVCAPTGSAFLWVSPDRQKDIHPAVVSHWLDEGFSKEFGWQGTRDISPWLTTPAALAFMANLGWDKVMDHNHRLAAWAHRLLCRQWGVESISPLDGSMLGSTATVPLPGKLGTLSPDDALAVSQRLYSEFRIEVPIVPWNGRSFLRVSAQVYNVPEQYERVGAVISGLL